MGIGKRECRAKQTSKFGMSNVTLKDDESVIKQRSSYAETF